MSEAENDRQELNKIMARSTWEQRRNNYVVKKWSQWWGAALVYQNGKMPLYRVAERATGDDASRGMWITHSGLYETEAAAFLAARRAGAKIAVPSYLEDVLSEGVAT